MELMLILGLSFAVCGWVKQGKSTFEGDENGK